MKNFSKNKKAFTLVEILLAIFIVVLAIGLALASFSDTKPLDEVTVAARGVASLIREAQGSSLNGRQQWNSSISKMEPVCWNGVSVSNEAGNGKIKVTNYYGKKASSECSEGTNNTEEKSTFIKNVQIEPSPSPIIMFSIPNGNVSLSGGSTPYQIIIKSTSKPDIKSSVCVYDSGRIEEIIGDGACP